MPADGLQILQLPDAVKLLEGSRVYRWRRRYDIPRAISDPFRGLAEYVIQIQNTKTISVAQKISIPLRFDGQ